MCNGYWYECDCEDCNRAKELYSKLEYLGKDEVEEAYEAVTELESMGYSI